ncbi:MAG: biotin transporter BioY [Thaumarchaeota archaeon]|nr:MAG: biotin transporter BioY [Nitrososphaerota archaeon]
MGDWPYPRSRGIALAATLAALISVASPINIPLDPITPVPITLQVFFVYLAGALLGARYGALSMVIYLVLGAVGIPVFSGPSSGPAVLFGFSGGYLFAFPVASLLGGYVARRRPATRRGDTIRVSLSALLSLLVIYVIGVVWLSYYLGLSLLNGVLAGAVPFIPLDLLKAVVAVPIAVRLRWSTLQLPVNTGGPELGA